MKASENAFKLVKMFEGCRLQPYQDQVGVWTVGYGSTTDVTPGEAITQAEAESRLVEDMSHAENCVNQLVTVQLTQAEFDSLCSWTFNLGCKRLRSSTMLQRINEQRFDDAVIEMRKWDMAGGKHVPGLIRRRYAESKHFESTPT